MKKTVLIIKNVSHEEPGLILEVLKEHYINYEIIDLSQRVKFPKIENISLIIIMGGPDSANDESEKILKELEFIKLAFKKKIPIFGICLGLQIMVKAYNGKVYKNPIEEIGFKIENEWFYISLTNEGIKDPLFDGIENKFKVFQLHGETITINENMNLLGTGVHCRNQIIKIDKFNYGFQFHFELTEKLLDDWLKLAPELENQDKISIINDFKSIRSSYTLRGKKIFSNYIKILNH